MRGSTIAFILLFVNLLLMYLSFTTRVETSYGMIMLFLNVPLVILLFLVRENILEFLKYMVYLVLMTVGYNYVEPYITYRGEAHLKKIALIKVYKERCLSHITDEKKLKESVDLWERDYNSEENIELSIIGMNKFKVILFFIDSNNTIDESFKIDDNMSALKKMNISFKMIGTKNNIERAIKDILTLREEERSIYKSENICYLSLQTEFLEKIKQEDYEDDEVRDFLFRICEGY